MNKEEFKQRLLETKIYLENKDKPISNISKFNLRCTKLYGPSHQTHISYNDIALRIMNYQIDKFDRTLCDETEFERVL